MLAPMLWRWLLKLTVRQHLPLLRSSLKIPAQEPSSKIHWLQLICALPCLALPPRLRPSQSRQTSKTRIHRSSALFRLSLPRVLRSYYCQPITAPSRLMQLTSAFRPISVQKPLPWQLTPQITLLRSRIRPTHLTSLWSAQYLRLRSALSLRIPTMS